MAERSTLGRRVEINFGRQRELKADQETAEEGHGQKGCVNKGIDDRFFKMAGGNQEDKGKKEGEADESEFRSQEKEGAVSYFLKHPDHKEAAGSDSRHKDSDQKADLIIEIAIKCLKGEDDSKVKEHVGQT